MMSETVIEDNKIADAAFGLHAIETGFHSESEINSLRDALTRSLDDADPLELPSYRSPRARRNAYLHRLQALRRDYVNVRLRVVEVEEQLREARSLIEQMRASRGWKIVERYRRCRRMFSSCFQRLRGLARRDVFQTISPADEACAR